MGSSCNSLELSDPLQHLPVLVGAEMVVGPTRVPGVEGVEPDDVKCRLGQLAAVANHHSVEVLIVPEGHSEVVQATVGLVHAIFGAVGG